MDAPVTPRPLWRERLAVLSEQLPFERPALAAIASVALAAGLGWLAFRPSPPPIELSLPRAEPAAVADAAAEAGSEVTVHAAGAVNAPGVYRLPPGARVSDLLAAAGGATAEADLDQLNLAAPLADGERIFVARRGESIPTAAAAPGGSASAPATKVDLNTATAEELDKLPGIGPATAEAIIRHRETHGRFRSVTELLEVRGIGEAKLAQLRPLVKV